jgi:hydrogenase maturation protease
MTTPGADPAGAKPTGADQPGADQADRTDVSARTLIAGIGNIFLGDDGFGCEVATRLAGSALPSGVRVVDYGIRGMHLAYDLAGGYQTAILVDATSRGEAPGTLYVIEPEVGPPAAGGDAGGDAARYEKESAGEVSPLLDAHGMQPDVVLRLLDTLGGSRPERLLIVGCEPASVEYGIGLSDAVAAVVDRAAAVVLELVADELASGMTAVGPAGADARSKLFTEGWTHVPRHSR